MIAAARWLKVSSTVQFGYSSAAYTTADNVERKIGLSLKFQISQTTSAKNKGHKNTLYAPPGSRPAVRLLGQAYWRQ